MGVASTLTGLKNIYYAKMTADTAESTTYGDPVKLGNAISVDINPTIEENKLYGDNMAVAVVKKLKEIAITISTTDIPLADRAIMLGYSRSTVNGSITVKNEDNAPYVALMFEATTADGGSHYYKFYKGRFAPSQQQIETEGESINWQTPSMEGTFIARESDGKVYDMIDSAETVSGAAELINKWFTNV